MEEQKNKFGLEITVNMGRAIGIGIVYIETGKEHKNEYYIFINAWKWCISIGRFFH